MSDQDQYYDLSGPIQARIACLAVTETTSKTDLSANAYVGKEFLAGSILNFHADGADVYVAFCPDNTLSALDETATATTAGKCVRIPEGQSRDWCMPLLNGVQQLYLYAKTKTGLTSTLRIAPSSISNANRVMY